MEVFYNVLKFLHFMGFVFMSTPLFNLIVVNERALLGSSFSDFSLKLNPLSCLAIDEVINYMVS